MQNQDFKTLRGLLVLILILKWASVISDPIDMKFCVYAECTLKNIAVSGNYIITQMRRRNETGKNIVLVVRVSE